MTSLRSHIRVTVALFVFGLVFIATTVYAQTPQCDGKGFCALAVPPPSSKLGQLYGTTSLAGFLNGLFTAAISIGAILAVLRIAYAGYEYMTSDAWGNKARAREIIGDVVLGLMLLLGTYLILNQINPQLLNLNILQNVSSVPNNKPDAGLQASLQLQQQNINNTTDSPSDYMPSLSQNPLPGYYCFPKTTNAGNLYSCVTNQTNCSNLAGAEGKKCTSY
ncbi:MAG: hypothetical protein AAB927_02810 [Patescibacteria group bacterium]